MLPYKLGNRHSFIPSHFSVARNSILLQELKMAEKEQSPYPLAPANGHGPGDEEYSGGGAAAAAEARELRKKKRTKCLIYIVAFAIFQTGIILLFALTVMRFKSPKFRVRSASFGSFVVDGRASPSFNLQMNTEFGVKNTNFGHFKYEVSTVAFAYRGITVGTVDVNKARARARSTRKFNETVILNSVSLPTGHTSQLISDISTGRLPLTSSSKLEGKIHLMKVIRRKKSAQMNCTMEVDVRTRTLHNIICK